MKCLLDADILSYEGAFAGEYVDEETGERVMRDLDRVIERLDMQIRNIQEACGADEPPLLFFTGDEKLLKHVNRSRKRNGEEPLQFTPNFRYEVAVSTPYKERKSEKPLHFDNVRAYLFGAYECRVCFGFEADDGMCFEQTQSNYSDTIICTRDKDLRQCPGWHYGWECGNQPEFGPFLVEGVGKIERTKQGIKGWGPKFFYSQMITGDTVDSIPGLKGAGPAAAIKALEDCETERQCYEAVRDLYQKKYGEEWLTMLKEQADLLWMIREVDEEGNPVFFRPPKED